MRALALVLCLALVGCGPQITSRDSIIIGLQAQNSRVVADQLQNNEELPSWLREWLQENAIAWEQWHAWTLGEPLP